MGRFDVRCKSFFSKPQNFADVINGAIFNGRMVVNAADLVGEILKIKFNKKHIKKTEEGDKVLMCKAWDDHYNSGKNEERENTVISMIKDNLPVEKIMKYVSISLDDLKLLSKKIGVTLTY